MNHLFHYNFFNCYSDGSGKILCHDWATYFAPSGLTYFAPLGLTYFAPSGLMYFAPSGLTYFAPSGLGDFGVMVSGIENNLAVGENTV